MAGTNDSHATVVAKYAVAIYFVAVLMILMPPLDVILSLPQYQPDSARWRFGALGLISGAMLVPIAGLLLASMTATITRQRWVYRTVLVVSALMGVVFLAVLVSFGLDAVQVRRETVAEVRRRYDITVLKTLLMQFTQVVAVALIGRSAWRADRARESERGTQRTPELFAGTVGR